MGSKCEKRVTKSGGYSPNQLVFGFNPNLPSVLNDFLPALEPTISSEIVRKNLEALHKARENFIKAESSEKIKRALRHKTRTFSDETFESGEKVFYRRKEGGWRGPGTVVGTDGKVILIRHGGSFYKCHPCHLLKAQRALQHLETGPFVIRPEKK